MTATQITTKVSDGIYSTVVLSDGSVETVFFPDNGEQSRVVSRRGPLNLRAIHNEDVADDRNAIN